MADSIVRLRLDSGDYDQKIRKAREGLLEMEKECRKVGGTLEVVEKDQLAYVQSLGKMETSARGLKGKIGELTSAFTDLKAMYNGLTDAEKKSPFGQAMSKSLNELKGRINDAKGELKGIQGEIGGTGGGLSDLAGKFGLNIGQLTKFGGALAAGTAALETAKSAFMSSETNVDEWGRTVESTKAIYDGFVVALNNMEISGFLSRIEQIVSAARNAYNAIDELGTLQTIRNPERAKLQSEVSELRATIRSRGANSKEGKAAQARLKELTPKYKQSILNEGQDNYAAFKALVDERLAEGGIKLNKKDYDMFMRTFSDESLFKRFRAAASGKAAHDMWKSADGAGSYKVHVADTRNMNKKLMDLFTDEWRKQNSGYLTAAFSAKGQAASVDLSNARYLNPRGRGPAMSTMEEITGRIPELKKQVKDLQSELEHTWDESEIAQYNAQLEITQKELSRLQNLGKSQPEKLAEKGTGPGGLSLSNISDYIKWLKEDLADADIGGESYNSLLAHLADTNALKNLSQKAAETGMDTSQFENIWNKILGTDGDAVSDVDWQAIVDQINEKLEEMQLDPIRLNFDTGGIEKPKELKEEGDKVTKAWQSASNAISNIGGALQAIDNPAAKVAGMIAQAIAQLALTFAKSLKGTLTPWDWIAAAAAGTSTLVGVISTIKSSTAGTYDTGGIVPGNSFHRGSVAANVESGELILNRSQQDSIAAQLRDNRRESGNSSSQPYVTGETLWLGINNYLRRSGRGEIITAR